MKRLVRILLAAVGVLGLLVVAAVIYVTTFFDPNDLKPRLVEAVKEQSGLELALEGPLSWSFYPRIGVSVEDARAWLPQQSAQDETFAAVDRAEVSLAFAPLLSGEIAIDGLTLDGMRLDLVRDAQGRGNWETLLERLDQQGDDAESALAPASAGPSMQDGGPNVALDIANVEVKNSEVHYADRRSDLDVTVRDLALTSSDVNPVNAFPLKASFNVDSAAPALESQVSLQSKVRLGLNDGRYELTGLTLDTQTHFAALPERAQTLDFDAKRLLAEVRNGRYRLEGGRLEGKFDHPALGESPLPLTLVFAAEANTNDATAQLHDIKLTGDDGLNLTGNLTVNALLSAPTYTGKVDLAPLSLRPWLERLGVTLNTADDAALEEVSLTSPIEGDASRVTLSKLTLLVDDTTLTGHLGLGLDGDSLNFDLQGNQLNLDAYLPPPDEAPAGDEATALLETIGVDKATAAAETPTENAELVPAATLRGLDLDGRLAFDTLIAKGLMLVDPVLVTRGSGGQLALERFDARLYDGTAHLEGTLDVREAPIRWAFRERLDGVQVVPLVEDYTGKPSPLRGRLTMVGDFTSRTNSADTLLRNLNGRADFHIDDGAVFNVNVSQELCTAVAALEGESTSREWSPDTRFDQIKGSVRVIDGVLNNDDLLITIPGIELTGNGRVKLASQRFDYDARARFVDTADVACNVNPRLERVPLPVHCEGQLSGDPQQWCGFDRQAFQRSLAELAKDELKHKAAEKISEKIEERLGGDDSSKELRDAIRGLLK
ncbi:AsmA family protein [Halomonas sp. HP20-15]|uniref:AsmA family protein n=1 Tax=Halomonas sp. HP20-15 TaxID=3085901 RepID=UPI002982A2E2|nr:AsmA family protein [Halomonas sp. HP20-15]MDW5378390.1 AsmA family protein [Halomonas sp. HP20-15]